MHSVEKIIKHTKHLKLLYVEDEINIIKSTLLVLEDFFDDIVVANDGKEGLDIYLKYQNTESKFDLIISDINMPNIDGLEMVREINKITNDTTIVMLSALKNPEYFVESIKQNVKGYLLKPLDLNQLIDVLDNVILDVQAKEIHLNLHKEKELLEVYAYYDELTKLPNRLLFNDRLEHGIQKAKRNSSMLGVFFIDLNKFKSINDTLGHEVGDFVLKTVSDLMQKCIRSEDTLSRIGGDEFTIIMENICKPEDTLILANKILDTLHKPICYNGVDLSISASIGISIYPDSHEDAVTLLKYADLAMYKAKRSENSNIVLYSQK